MKIFSTVISGFFMLLFIYTAFDKLAEINSFQSQLQNNSLIGEKAVAVSYLIIALEIVIAGLLSYSKTRKKGLLLSLITMVLFSCYVYYMLHYSANIPCSCGGIIEDMTWQQHLYFNVGCVGLAGIAIIALEKTKKKTEKRFPLNQ